MTSEDPSAALRRRQWIGAVATGLAFGLVGLLFGLHKVAVVLLKHIVVSDPSLAFQEVSDLLPVPRKLDWNVPFVQFLVSLRELHGPSLILACALVFIVLGGLFLLIVTQTSASKRRLEVLADGPRDLGSAHPGSDHEGSMKLADSAEGGEATAAPHEPGVGLVSSATSAGEAPLDAEPTESYIDGDGKTHLAPDGAPHPNGEPTEGSGNVGQTDSPADARAPSGLPSTGRAAGRGPRPARRPFPVLATVLFAAAFGPLAYFAAPAPSELLLRYYHTLGTFHQGYFDRIALPAVASCAAAWMAAGLLLNALAVHGRGLGRRLLLCLLAAALGGTAFWCALSIRVNAALHDWTPAILTMAPPYLPDKSVYGVPDGLYPARLLAQRTGIAIGEQPAQPERPLVVFLPAGAMGMPTATFANVVQSGFTEDGLSASLESELPVRKFLESRTYESALSWVAIKHRYNVAVLHFNPTAAIEACMTDMERCPHLSQCGATTRGMLFVCAASPENLALVDRWADETRYTHPTRESQRLVGALYERFGRRDKALQWYRRAEMPKSFIARVEGGRALFNAGEVSGKITLNGKALAGVQVGVIPRRMNGLPPDMEPLVLRARGDIMAFRPYGIFPEFHPRPYAMRWISGSSITDSTGRFDIRYLTEGEYQLVCTLPSSVHLDPPSDPRLTVANVPPGLVLNYSHKARDLGTIAFKVR